jgi:[acyl-carrier-protein] S-malonyltransferase
MIADGVDTVWKVGAGKALSGMIRRIDRSVATQTVGTAADVPAALKQEV